MSRSNLIVAIISLIVVVIAALAILYREHTISTELKDTIAQLREGDPSAPIQPLSPQSIDQKLDAAKIKLAESSSRVSNMKGTVSGIIGQSQALQSIGEAKVALKQLDEQARQMMTAHAEVLVAMSDLQARYESKITDLESQLNEVSQKKSAFNLEFLIGVAGLITGASSVGLGWRKDSREAQELRRKLDSRNRPADAQQGDDDSTKANS